MQVVAAVCMMACVLPIALCCPAVQPAPSDQVHESSLRTSHPPLHLPLPLPPPHRQPADEDGLSFPPYSINVGSGRWPLHSKTLPMNARHHSGAVQYDVHNLNGLLEVRTSHLAMKRFLAKRPFILSRWGQGRERRLVHACSMHALASGSARLSLWR